MAGGSLELLVLFEQLFDLVLKGFSRVLGHLVTEVVENTISKAIQAFAFLIPVVLEGSRLRQTGYYIVSCSADSTLDPQ